MKTKFTFCFRAILAAVLSAVSLQGFAADISRVRAENTPLIWGNFRTIKDIKTTGPVLKSGFYAINPVSEPVFQPLCDNVSPSAVIDGKMYTFYTDNDNPFDVHHYYMVQDIRTWETLQEEELPNSFLVPIEVAHDQINAVLYGQFNDGGLQIARFDPIGKTKTVIGSSPRRYVAMGVNSAGELYGIGVDANLYRISTTDASETLIGSTGIKLAMEGYQMAMYYDQSGEIDQTSDIFYWASTNGKGESVLYRVNLKDASLSKIADFQNKVLASMLIPLGLSADAAPASVRTVDFSFDKASLQGEISFAIPSHTYAGNALDGKVDWSLYVNDEQIKSGQGNAGESICVPTNLPDGQSRIKIDLMNVKGLAYPFTVYRWAGYDVPKTIENLNIVFNQNEGKVELKWDAPQGSLHGGYMGAITYNVYRISKAGNVQVAEGISETSFSETLDSGGILKSISYGVEPVNGDKKGEISQTKGIIWGTPNITPWSEDFSSQENFDLWTVEDTNGDKMTWTCIPYFKAAYSGGSNNVDCDDWLFSPPVKLDEGKKYKLSYTADNTYAMYGFVQKLEVKLGSGAESRSMSKELVESYNVDNSGDLKDVIFTVDKSGVYNIGFHDISPADMNQIGLSNITIEELSTDEAPAAIDNLDIKPSEKGELSVNIRFTAPVFDKKGDKLEAITKIEITRGNDLIKSFENVVPGDEVGFVDNSELKNGNYTYSVIAYNEGGPGDKVEGTVYVGLDRPQAVNGIQIADNISSVNIKWQPASPFGLNGGYVNPEDIVYYIYEVNSDNIVQKELGHTSNHEFEIPYQTNVGEQKQSRWSVIARNEAGSDSNCLFADNSVAVANVKVITGKPYVLPYQENFSNQTFAQYCWREHTSYRFYTAFAQGMSSDGDDVSLAFTIYELGENTDGHFTTGKISLENAVEPYIQFDYYFLPGVDMRYEVSFIDDKLVKHNLGTIDYNNPGVEGWKSARFNISDVGGSSYIMARIHSYINETGSPMLIDNVRVLDANTGVNDIYSEQDGELRVYNLQGMKIDVSSVEELAPGIYIINGKKMLIE